MNCFYCMDEATHVEEDPEPRPANPERKKEARHYCNRHAAERLLKNKKTRIDQLNEKRQ